MGTAARCAPGSSLPLRLSGQAVPAPRGHRSQAARSGLGKGKDDTRVLDGTGHIQNDTGGAEERGTASGTGGLRLGSQHPAGPPRAPGTPRGYGWRSEGRAGDTARRGRRPLPAVGAEPQPRPLPGPAEDGGAVRPVCRAGSRLRLCRGRDASSPCPLGSQMHLYAFARAAEIRGKAERRAAAGSAPVHESPPAPRSPPSSAQARGRPGPRTARGGGRGGGGGAGGRAAGAPRGCPRSPAAERRCTACPGTGGAPARRGVEFQRWLPGDYISTRGPRGGPGRGPAWCALPRAAPPGAARTRSPPGAGPSRAEPGAAGAQCRAQPRPGPGAAAAPGQVMPSERPEGENSPRLPLGSSWGDSAGSCKLN